MAEPLVSFSVKTLLNLLVQEANFLVAVRDEVDDMTKELTMMQSFLIDADRRRGQDAAVASWVVQIRELAYDTEEVIATFVVEVAGAASATSVGSQPVCFNMKRFFRLVKTSPTRHTVGMQIQVINRKISALGRSLITLGVQSTPNPPSTRARITYSTVVEENLVGLQDHVTAVVAHLKDMTHSRVISIWGIGGLGKTTFSKEILRHREIKHYFNHSAWVCVSQNCNPDHVWRDVLLQFAHESEEEKKIIRKLTPNELVSILHSLQREKKCMLILDDIWKQEDWNSLSPAFPRSTTTGSKIVLTTRNKVIVSHADIRCFPYNLPLLEKKECLELLKKKVSADDPGFIVSTELKNIMEEIVEHCGGLPLAVVLVGGLLAKDKHLEEWKKVQLDLHHCFNKGNDRDGGVKEVLALSYLDLPYHLKACFLYLSLFPEDHDISAKELVQMWIAEGFVLSGPARMQQRKTMFDVGLSYLDELVNRCMVQSNLTKVSRRVKTCRLHDLMREFCLSKAQEENFFEDLEQSIPSICASPSPNKIRRLAVHLKDNQQVTNIPTGQHHHVRSCLVHWPKGDRDRWDKINPLLTGFKFLKVFNTVGPYNENGYWKISEDIGKLIHLRYLRVALFAIKPSSLGGLVSLQTLDLRRSYGEVPDVLWKLKELRHLYLPRYSVSSTYKLCLDGLSKLEILENFDTRCSDVRDLATLPNLWKLLIDCQVEELGQIFQCSMFGHSNSHLRHSTFRIRGAAKTQEEHNLLCQALGSSHVFRFMLHDGPLYNETFLLNLNGSITSIDLFKCGLKEDPMPALGKMPNLRKLELGLGSYIGEKMLCLGPKKTTTETITAGSFPRLTFLYLQLLQISEWEVEEGAMPCLSRLTIMACKRLKEIPDGLRFIAALEMLLIVGINKSLEQRLQEGGEDFQRIQHVPFLTINHKTY